MFKSWQILFSLVLAIALALAIPLASHAAPGDTTRVSLATDGTEGNLHSQDPAISADGRYVAFESRASNLVSGDTNGSSDIFVHDTQSGTTTRVSLATDGTEGNGVSSTPAISADGRYVAFMSFASNLVSGDTNGVYDIFVRDTQTGTTTRVSLATDGTEGNSGSYDSALSADGRYVAFMSFASNLVSGDTNGSNDIFVHDTQSGTTTRVSLATDGTEGNSGSYTPAISADGRYVAFSSFASNLVSGDTNERLDIFVHDTQSGTTTRVSRATDGTEGNGSSDGPAISADGRYVAFWSYASNLVSGDTNGTYDIFVHDTQSGTTTRVSLAMDGTEGSGSSYNPAISADGRYVAFESYASNLVSGDTNGVYDIFVRDTQSGTTTRVSLATDGTEGNNDSSTPAISADGRYVGFNSVASNLVSGDTNGSNDIFVHENDIDAPTGSIDINGGAAYTNTTSVTLNLSANDTHSGMDDMRFSNNGTVWSTWESYATSKVWALLSGDGTKTVYVQYRDNAGNVSSSYNDTIVLDVINPSSSASSPSSTVTLSFTVTWSGSDATSGIDSYDVQYRVGSAGTWTNWFTGTTTISDVFGPSSPVTVVQGQTYYFRVRARDNAGNLEAYPGGDGDTETFISFGCYLPLIMRD